MLYTRHVKLDTSLRVDVIALRVRQPDEQHADHARGPRAAGVAVGAVLHEIRLEHPMEVLAVVVGRRLVDAHAVAVHPETGTRCAGSAALYLSASSQSRRGTRSTSSAWHHRYSVM